MLTLSLAHQRCKEAERCPPAAELYSIFGEDVVLAVGCINDKAAVCQAVGRPLHFRRRLRLPGFGAQQIDGPL